MTYHLMHENKTGQKKREIRTIMITGHLWRKGEGAWNNKYEKTAEGGDGNRLFAPLLLVSIFLNLVLAWLAPSSTHQTGRSRRRGEVGLSTNTACRSTR
jgi:hypothetical protein